MAKKTTGSHPPRTRAKPGTALIPITTQATGGALVRVDDGTEEGTVFRQGDVTLVVRQRYPMGGRDVVVDAAYYVGSDEAAKTAHLGGADKVAWKDAATGYECIIIRDPRRKFLSGYVGVEPGHPLYGFAHNAVPPELDIEVHGGLSYSAICKEGPSPQPLLSHEVVQICHVPPRVPTIKSATDHRPGHEAAWWFGFACDQIYDVVPGELNDRSRFFAGETGATFKDEGYLYDQVTNLAAQLRAIADGAPKPPRTGASPPPLGLDPRKAR